MVSIPIKLSLLASIPVIDNPPSAPKPPDELFEVAAVTVVDVLVALNIPAVSLTPLIFNNEAANDSFNDPPRPESA